MQPRVELRMRTMIRALAETVLPSVDPENRAAVEQMRLVTGSREWMSGAGLLAGARRGRPSLSCATRC